MMNLKVTTELGRGGFGIVHKVLDDKGNGFARKTYQINQSFTPDAAMDRQLRKRFDREAKLQSGMRHKNIVPIVEKFLDESPPYFLMPLAESTLEKDIQADRHLDGNYLKAISDIIAGLEELHAVHIYHRDLKPANVLRFKEEETGEDYYAISDFGLMALKQTQMSVLTTVGMKMSSDFFTAPEITQDLTKATPQSDIYSLGCILHELVGTEQRVPCSEIKEVGPYSAILLSCTRRDPERRFKSVGAVREALLQVATVPGVTTSISASALQSLLLSGSEMNRSDWSNVADFLEDNAGSTDAALLLQAISQERIQEMMRFRELSLRIGACYAEWIRTGTFIFANCDGLANRLSDFLALPDVALQSDCLLALLFMGTSHNRWHIEKMFFSYACSKLSDELAGRLAVEFRADKDKIREAIRHLEWSISVTRENLHPLLKNTLTP